MSFSPALPVQTGPLACVHPLDAELLAAGAAELAQSMLHSDPGEDRAEHWRYLIAHTEALELIPSARVALIVAADRLQQLLAAQEALEYAGATLARELVRQAG